MRNFIEIFDRQYKELHINSCAIIEQTPPDKLFFQPSNLDSIFPMNSVGESILRSAGAVEQTFGGITARLWDDPFEWTLPESLSTNGAILDYLSETELTRQKGFEMFQTDEDLRRQIPAPEKLKTLFEILLQTIARAENLQGRALSIIQMLSTKS